MGQSLPRLDVPSKVDGSANFAGDIRLPDIVHAAIRQGPIGDSRLVSVNRAAADRIRGVLQVIENPRWGRGGRDDMVGGGKGAGCAGAAVRNARGAGR